MLLLDGRNAKALHTYVHTDQRTDTRSYRVASLRLKISTFTDLRSRPILASLFDKLPRPALRASSILVFFRLRQFSGAHEGSRDECFLDAVAIRHRRRFRPTLGRRFADANAFFVGAAFQRLRPFELAARVARLSEGEEEGG